MNNFLLTAIFLILGIPIFAQIDWIDDINRNENLRVNKKNSIALSNIKSSTHYYGGHQKSQLTPNSYPLFKYEYDTAGNAIAEYCPSHTDSAQVKWNFKVDLYDYSKQIYFIIGEEITKGSYSTYLFDNYHNCTETFQKTGYNTIKTKIEYNQKGHISSIVAGDSGKYDTTIVYLTYDEDDRLIKSHACRMPEVGESYCQQHKEYYYQGDSIIIHHLIEESVFERTIVQIDSNHNIRLYEQISYQSFWYPDRKKNKIQHRDKWAYDEYGNNIEFVYYDCRTRGGNVHHYYQLELDENGNVLKFETRNKKGKLIQTNYVEYEYF